MHWPVLVLFFLIFNPKLKSSLSARISLGSRFSRTYQTIIGKFAYIGFGFYSSVPLTISDEAMIGPRVSCVGGDHDISLSNVSMRFSPRPEALPIFIGRGSWIGCNVVILQGVVIGEGCVVGAGSVVTKSTPPNSIVCGNPAAVIKYRS